MAAPNTSPPPDIGPRGWITDLGIAAAFLTRLPIRTRIGAVPGRLGAAAWAFPVIGAAVGLGGGLLYALAFAIGLTPALAAMLAVAGQIWLTGALHEDAAGDVADGFGGGGSRADKLRIMRDSRVGTYAVVTLVLMLGLRIGALAAFADSVQVIAALIAAGSASRAGMAAAMAILRPARNDGLGAGAGRPGTIRVGVAVGLAIAISFGVLAPMPALAMLVASGIGSGAVGWLARRQIGGQTGDVLGACQQAGEVAGLAALVVMAA
ncbi:MAG: adenosylcobinamide-GDP ribazoletransferase [Alphaproteobacteria bacterium]|jgi:adenosylcobinamide-GDP ribazoletransferase|nr:adenosylcobinamide-GDP ribazoletransferase [Alphaproteobacteria bacterium]MDP6516005.1 adenosylcobinamide-GDP ribazoletransferase [Alphaproteobacteria bacterium]